MPTRQGLDRIGRDRRRDLPFQLGNAAGERVALLCHRLERRLDRFQLRRAGLHFRHGPRLLAERAARPLNRSDLVDQALFLCLLAHPEAPIHQLARLRDRHAPGHRFDEAACDIVHAALDLVAIFVGHRDTWLALALYPARGDDLVGAAELLGFLGAVHEHVVAA
jgi:hypothetical protein